MQQINHHVNFDNVRVNYIDTPVHERRVPNPWHTRTLRFMRIGRMHS